MSVGKRVGHECGSIDLGWSFRMNVTIKISWWHVLGVLVVALVVWWAVPAGSQPVAPQPVSSFAFVARADNPVDALAASSVAGQLGAPVFLTGTDSLDDQARQGAG
jgi:putative cell wall-binding protein